SSSATAPRVLILSPEGQDPFLYISTLPALAETLRRRGASVEIVSPWLPFYDPRSLPSPRTALTPEWQGIDGIDAWLAKHSLNDFDLVITTTFPVARLALAAGNLRPEARIVVVDFHMLGGMNEAVAAWLPVGARPADGTWWPSKQLILESAFPGYVQLYINYGVPLEQLAWRPFALYPGHFPAGPDVHQCDYIFSGGNHLRDLETLRQASAKLASGVHPIDLYAPGERFAGNDHLRHRGFVSMAAFHQAAANSRFVVLPLHEEVNRATGVTVLAMALLAGRPIVATDIMAIRDYVQHEAEALLVPPGDAAALADAITRLDTDSALLSRLAAGARTLGQRLSTEHWADQIASRAPLLPVSTAHGWRNW
ncbi:MAG: glycosyltransferase, partial [Deltaproteobacteria bacterium]|nr:glycosyltransferase [Deltaproteobacteria bacterium]